MLLGQELRVAVLNLLHHEFINVKVRGSDSLAQTVYSCPDNVINKVKPWLNLK